MAFLLYCQFARRQYRKCLTCLVGAQLVFFAKINESTAVVLFLSKALRGVYIRISGVVLLLMRHKQLYNTLTFKNCLNMIYVARKILLEQYGKMIKNNVLLLKVTIYCSN